MKVEWKREARHIWMILSGEDGTARDSYVFRMLAENHIPGLLPCRAAQLDQTSRLYYDLSGWHALHDILETSGLRQELLEALLTALAGICEKLEDYLLPADGLLLTPERIFLGAGDTPIVFCYYPGYAVSFREQLQSFAEALLPHLDQQDKAAVVTGYRFYQKSLSEDLPRLVFSDLLQNRSKPEQEPAPVTREEMEQSALLDSFFGEEEEEPASVFRRLGSRIRSRLRREPEEAPAFPEIRKRHDPPSPPANEAPAGPRTMLLDGAVSHGMARTPFLHITYEDGRQENLCLERDAYLVGKSGTGADLALSSGAVSRMHARLTRQGDTYTVRDLHSRNGTVWNGQTLLPEEERLLADGDTIVFADVACVYQRI